MVAINSSQFWVYCQRFFLRPYYPVKKRLGSSLPYGFKPKKNRMEQHKKTKLNDLYQFVGRLPLSYCVNVLKSH